MASNGTSKEVKEIIHHRLKSSWGKYSSSLEPSLPRSGPLPELHRLILNVKHADANKKVSCWNAVLKYCQSHPNQVGMVDGRGRNSLSYACALNPPLAVIETMLSSLHANEEMPDKTGMTAMTIAITHHASLQVVKLLAISRPRLVVVSDHHGNTPLHLACQTQSHRQYANNVIKILLQVSPLVGRENNNGKTPLHLAIQHGASLEVVRMLCEAAPQAIVNNTCGRTPLFYAISNLSLEVCKLLIKSNPQVTQIRDECGRFPLQWALAQKVRDSKLVELLCVSQKAVLNVDSLGRNALQLALEKPTVNPCIVDTLLRRAPPVARANGIVKRCFSAYMQANKERVWWTVLCKVLRAHEYETVEYSMLHAALATLAPASVIRRILEESPQEARRTNAQGRYPLAIVSQQHAREKDKVVHLLLDVDSSVVKLHDNENDASILSLLAQCGGVCSITIYRIICANPCAVRSLDPRHQMYPCMIAAAAKNDGDERDCVIEQVGAIYELLLAAPDLVSPMQQCITGS